MKKWIATLLILALALSISACNAPDESTGSTPSNSSSGTTAPTQNSTEPTTEYAPEGISFLGCHFTEEVTAQDKELTQTLYSDGGANSVYVDMTFYISSDYMAKNNAPYFTATLEYDEKNYELQYDCENDSNTGFHKKAVPATGGFIHMFVMVPHEAQKLAGSLEVNYTIDNVAYSCVVDEKVAIDPLANKTELAVGFKDMIFDGKVEMEVVDIRCADYLLATHGGENDRLGYGPFMDIVLRVTNHFDDIDLSQPLGYFIDGIETYRCFVKTETNNNTKLEDYTSIEPGQTQYLHVIASVDDETKEVGMRLNYGGKLYYCTVPNTEYVERIWVRAYVPNELGVPSCWAWIDGGDNVFPSWPGNEMEEHASHYQIRIPTWADHVIINWNKGSGQTENIAIEPGKDIWIVIHQNATDYTLFYKQPTSEELKALGY